MVWTFEPDGTCAWQDRAMAAQLPWPLFTARCVRPGTGSQKFGVTSEGELDIYIQIIIKSMCSAQAAWHWIIGDGYGLQPCFESARLALSQKAPYWCAWVPSGARGCPVVNRYSSQLPKMRHAESSVLKLVEDMILTCNHENQISNCVSIKQYYWHWLVVFVAYSWLIIISSSTIANRSQPSSATNQSIAICSYNQQVQQISNSCWLLFTFIHS